MIDFFFLLIEKIIYLLKWLFRAGTTLTVTDTTDPDWWQGKTHGQVGLFPSKYVAKLYSGERPLQMLHTIQVSDGEGSMIKLLRDQVNVDPIKVTHYQYCKDFYFNNCVCISISHCRLLFKLVRN